MSPDGNSSKHRVLWAEAHDDVQKAVGDRDKLRRRLIALWLLSDQLILHPSFVWRSEVTRSFVLNGFQDLFREPFSQVILGTSYSVQHYLEKRLATLTEVEQAGFPSLELSKYEDCSECIAAEAPILDSRFASPTSHHFTDEAPTAIFKRVLGSDLSTSAPSKENLRNIILTHAAHSSEKASLEELCDQMRQWAEESNFVSRETFVQILEGRGRLDIARDPRIVRRLLVLFLGVNVATDVIVPRFGFARLQINAYDPRYFEPFLKDLLGVRRFRGIYEALSDRQLSDLIIGLKSAPTWIILRDAYMSALSSLNYAISRDEKTIVAHIRKSVHGAQGGTYEDSVDGFKLSVTKVVLDLVGATLAPFNLLGWGKVVVQTGECMHRFRKLSAERKKLAKTALCNLTDTLLSRARTKGR